jgi:hypothetical protein
MTINFVAILLAAVVSWVAGAAWYGVFGKVWRTALGVPADAPRVVPVVPMIISFVAEVLMALLLSGLLTHLAPLSVRAGLIGGAGCWLAFIATTITVNNAYQGRARIVTIIDCGHWLAVLLLQGLVLGLMG